MCDVCVTCVCVTVYVMCVYADVGVCVSMCVCHVCVCVCVQYACVCAAVVCVFVIVKKPHSPVCKGVREQLSHPNSQREDTCGSDMQQMHGKKQDPSKGETPAIGGQWRPSKQKDKEEVGRSAGACKC